MGIELKKPAWQDMHFIQALWADSDTMAPVGGAVTLSDQEARRWFARMIDPGEDTNRYRLILNESGKRVGEISFHHLDQEHMRASFNIKILARFRGNGYAKSAMQAFLDEFFNRLNGREMFDDIAPDNIGGQQVLLKFGFIHDPSTQDVFRVHLKRHEFNRLYRFGIQNHEQAQKT